MPAAPLALGFDADDTLGHNETLFAAALEPPELRTRLATAGAKLAQAQA